MKSLNLPKLRFRKLNGILNAITMQIEDGADFPEVNKLLIRALRTIIIAQVGEESARASSTFKQKMDSAHRGRARFHFNSTDYRQSKLM